MKEGEEPRARVFTHSAELRKSRATASHWAFSVCVTSFPSQRQNSLSGFFSGAPKLRLPLYELPCSRDTAYFVFETGRVSAAPKSAGDEVLNRTRSRLATGWEPLAPAAPKPAWVWSPHAVPRRRGDGCVSASSQNPLRLMWQKRGVHSQGAAYLTCLTRQPKGGGGKPHPESSEPQLKVQRKAP